MARWRLCVLVAAALVVGLTATVLVVVVSQRDVAAEAFDCSVVEAPSLDVAASKAAACEIEIEVTGERTPWESTFSLPDGNTKLVASAMPTRVLADGEWTVLDTTVDGEPGDGGLEVAAPVYPMTFNAGGQAGEGQPLGSIERDGERFEVWFPSPLPVPTIEGSKVVYDLAEGVRLVVSVLVDGTGFLPVVELADQAAADRFAALLDAARPAGTAAVSGSLVFSTRVSDGLRLQLGQEGAVLVVDSAGDTHFLSAPPVMWDSAGGEQEFAATVTEVSPGDRERSPSAGDAIAAMGAAVDGDRIVITPDGGMLSDPRTVWPVYIDPMFGGHSPAEWVAVRTGGFTGTLYKWTTSGGEGTGYCTDVPSCNTVFRQRLTWEFNGMDVVRNMDRVNVVSATFQANGIHSASCTATTTDLRLTYSVTTASNWNNLGDWSQLMSSRTEAHRSSCGTPGYRTWDATEALRRFAENDWATVTMGLMARDESTMTSWKRFGHDATLAVTYNQPPAQPVVSITDPSVACTTGANQPFVNTIRPKLSTKVTDPNGNKVAAHFQIVQQSSQTTEVWKSGTFALAANKSTFTINVADKTLVNNGRYRVHATAKDEEEMWSGWGGWCDFTVDTQAPSPPTVKPVTAGVVAVYEENVERGAKGQLGKFTLGWNGSTDVRTFEYTFSTVSGTRTATPTASGEAVIEHTPAAAGPVVLTVVSIDRAGNRATKTYKFDVAAPKEDAVWKLDEGAGTTAANSGPLQVGSLTVTGAGWEAGPLADFGARESDWALKFDDLGDVAVARGPVVDTTKSFTVSAHVKLDPDRVETGNYAAVLAQDGLVQSGFRLRYRPVCPVTDTPGYQVPGCWEFLVMGPDARTDATPKGSSSHVMSAVEVRPDEWVHLVAEHDAAEQKIRLWVCNAGTPENPAPGEPIMAEAARTVIPLSARGAFTVGRAKHNGSTTSDRFLGSIDNIRVFSGEVVDDAKIRRLCQGAEAEDLGGGAVGLDALDPTKEDQQ